MKNILFTIIKIYISTLNMVTFNHRSLFLYQLIKELTKKISKIFNQTVSFRLNIYCGQIITIIFLYGHLMLRNLTIISRNFRETLKADVDSRGRHMSMDQFRRLFSTCRVPAPQRDSLKTYFRTGMIWFKGLLIDFSSILT